MYSFSGTSSDGTYTLRAVPNRELDTEGWSHLNALTFIASDGYDSHTWTVVNRGRFVVDFSLLVDAGTAYRLFQDLREGKDVMFPCRFSLEFLRMHLEG
jgi:hypothetical protein